MDRQTTSAALAAVLVSFALTGCGGNNTSAATTEPPATIQGVTTPPTVTVVTPKNIE
jgi:hypothetical protein